MPRFVILEHDYPQMHWDFMLEAGAALKTWRLAKQPGIIGEWMEALSLGDHRMAYLDYEGPLSGARGQVCRWDSGEFEILPTLEGETVKVQLKGKKIHGTVEIKEMESQWFFRIAP